MEIHRLKEQLDIIEVAERLGIKVNKYRKALCPFHDDKRPSLQFSKEKQIATCFSAQCSAGTMDVINLAEKKLKLNTHEAIKWLQNEYNLNGGQAKKQQTTNATNFPKLFRVFEANLKKSEKAKAYLKERALDPEKLEAGYNGTAWERMQHCIIFPLKDKKGQIVSFYGRSVIDNTNSKHFYNSNRQGLYPAYPNTETLILTESVIDNATLQQYLPRQAGTDYPTLALYGTNGMTEEHQTAIKELYHLKEIILFFDGDQAGKEAIKRNGEILHNLRAEVKITYVDTPEGEDINSLAVNHPGEEKELFAYLIENRKLFSFSLDSPSLENEEKPPSNTAKINTENPAFAKLRTENPELLRYQTNLLNIVVLGGIKIAGLDRLRVTLKIEHNEKRYLLPIRHNLDLYHNGQSEQLAQKISEQMELTTREATEAIAGLTGELEAYREKKLEALKPKKPDRRGLSESEKREALAQLKNMSVITTLSVSTL